MGALKTSVVGAGTHQFELGRASGGGEGNYPSSGKKKVIRAADAKEVGVGNPAEETYRHPNQITGGNIQKS
jgi:hypothetical protein